MEHIIKEILNKHGIEDEKLAAALAEILDLTSEKVQQDIYDDYQRKMIVQGRRP